MIGAPPSDTSPGAGDVPAKPERVAMPVEGTGSRRQRRERRRQRRRRRRMGVVMAILGAVAIILGVVVLAADELDDLSTDPSGDPGPTATSLAPAEAGTGPPRALLVQLDDAQQAVSLTLFVVGEDGAGGHVVFVPPGTMVEAGALGLVPLREAAADGSLPVLQQAIENLLGFRLDEAATADPITLAAMAEPAGVLTVSVPEAVEEVGESGRIEVLFEEGEVAVAPDDVPVLLAAPDDGSDLDRLARHRVFWEAWLAAVTDVDLPDIPAPGVSEVIESLAAGEVEFHVLPVETVASGADGTPLYQPILSEVRALAGRLVPGGAAGPVTRARVQVLNGTGEPGLSELVQPLLVSAGAELSLTGNASRFDHEVTQIVFYDDEDQPIAEAVRDALGVGEVVKNRNRIEVVDVTVVVGTDFLDLHGRDQTTDDEDG